MKNSPLLAAAGGTLLGSVFHTTKVWAAAVCVSGRVAAPDGRRGARVTVSRKVLAAACDSVLFSFFGVSDDEWRLP